MLYNDTENIRDSRMVFSKIKYYEYLNLIELIEVYKIDCRIRHPLAMRKYAAKTSYKINNNFKQDYLLVKSENINEQYKIHLNGKSVSTTRI